MSEIMRALEGSRDRTEAIRRFCTLALASPTITEAERLTMVASRLPVHSWPQNRLVLVAVDMHNGERVAIGRESGVNLVEAVAASSALPGVWPPITINGHRYIDGGAYSFENADLAVGFDRVLVLQFAPSPFPWASIDTQVEQLQRSGALVEVVVPDEAMKAVLASVDGDVLNPSVRDLAARAGREQGRSIAARVTTLWSGQIVPGRASVSG